MIGIQHHSIYLQARDPTFKVLINTTYGTHPNGILGSQVYAAHSCSKNLKQQVYAKDLQEFFGNQS